MTTLSAETGIKVERPSSEKLAELQVTTWPTWECEASTFDWHFDSKETCYFLQGAVTVETDAGQVSFGKGDLVTFPRDLSCRWHVHEAVRKHYLCE